MIERVLLYSLIPLAFFAIILIANFTRKNRLKYIELLRQGRYADVLKIPGVRGRFVPKIYGFNSVIPPAFYIALRVGDLALARTILEIDVRSGDVVYNNGQETVRGARVYLDAIENTQINQDPAQLLADVVPSYTSFWTAVDAMLLLSDRKLTKEIRSFTITVSILVALPIVGGIAYYVHYFS